MASPDSAPTELRMLTLNCWGLKYLSAHRSARLQEIGRRIAAQQPPPDIVGLQECWTQADYAAIRQATAAMLPHGKFYHSGALGGGLAILARWPLEAASMRSYPLNGRPTAFWRGDWFVGKGVASARVRYGPAARQVVEVLNTHTHAPYERHRGPQPDGGDTYLCHGLAQSWEVGKLLRGAAERGHLVVGLGDFNMTPGSLAHRVLAAHAAPVGVRDVWAVLHPDAALGACYDAEEQARGRPVPDAAFNIAENGVTSDSVYCTWRWTKAEQRLRGPGQPLREVSPDTPDPRGHRLDYVFAGGGDAAALGGRWAVADARVGMMERHPELGCSLSDHFSVEATLAFRPTAGDTTTATGSLDPDPGARLTPAAYDEMLASIHWYMARERAQRWWRGVHFWVSVAVSVACLVAIWFVGRWPFAGFLLALLSTLNLAAGVVDGLIAILFLSWEIRALKEFEWEVENAKKLAAATDVARK